MATRNEIIEYADEMLDAAGFSDYGPNGLQVAGAAEVTTIATAVSCTLDVFERAAALGAQLVLVHHGLFWRNTPQVIDRFMRERLRTLFDADINLVAYHLPLDAHSSLGNNALILKKLGLDATELPFALHGGRPIGLVGRFAAPLDWGEFTGRVRGAMGQDPLLLGIEPETVQTVAVCSGGAAGELPAAIELGADVLVTGEPAEGTHAAATEGNIAFVAAGHYASETFGVRALGEQLAAQFGLQHEFLRSPNPV